jgi:hypothetical protein
MLESRFLEFSLGDAASPSFRWGCLTNLGAGICLSEKGVDSEYPVVDVRGDAFEHHRKLRGASS